MPSRNWQLRIQDILESIAEIEKWTTEITFEEFENNPKIVKAILYNFIIIGEAAKNIPNEIQSR